MKKLLLTGVAFAALIEGSAMAADLVAPVYGRGVATPVAVSSWTGFYVGANAGYSWGETDKVRNKQGFTGGGQIGYDYQFGRFLLGLEADVNWRNATHDVIWTAPNGTDVTSYHSEQDWFGTVRSRFGFTLYNLLIYGTGGGLYGDIEHQVTENRVTVSGANRTVSASGVRPGWTAGAGIEWALYHWILGVEMAPFGLRNRHNHIPRGDTGRREFPRWIRSVSRSIGNRASQAELQVRPGAYHRQGLIACSGREAVLSAASSWIALSAAQPAVSHCGSNQRSASPS